MAKGKTYFVCSSCGYESVRWLGKCPNCGAWDSFKEFREQPVVRRDGTVAVAKRLKEIEIRDFKKISTGIYEFDRVLDDGITPSSLILIGGDPGIGKSTLILQVAKALSDKSYKVLYVSGEESLEQVKIRADRLGASSDFLFLLNEQDLSKIKEELERVDPSFLIIDSIQTVFNPDVDQVVGSISQIRECGAELLRVTKEIGITTIIVGHVTKDGSLAGPKTLEHMVDVVLYLEGDRVPSGGNGFNLRILRCSKNRFGTSNEIGIFEMTGNGLKEVTDASTLFITTDHVRRDGISYTVLMEGKRVILVEIQSLVLPTFFAVPQRVATGFDTKRLYMLLAVVEKFAGINLRGMDIFLNVTGGIRIQDSSGDLAVIASIVSSYRKRSLPENSVFVGEVGLGGEIRKVPGITKRIEEAKRLGFTNVYSPLEYNSIEEVLRICLG
ncbi:MAG: DNA repair protein RadA [Candidatus Hydrothermia bacterium]|nr:DNA repair protein RadA [Candidatus Hydrothermia bacterium]